MRVKPLNNNPLSNLEEAWQELNHSKENENPQKKELILRIRKIFSEFIEFQKKLRSDHNFKTTKAGLNTFSIALKFNEQFNLIKKGYNNQIDFSEPINKAFKHEFDSILIPWLTQVKAELEALVATKEISSKEYFDFHLALLSPKSWKIQVKNELHFLNGSDKYKKLFQIRQLLAYSWFKKNNRFNGVPNVRYYPSKKLSSPKVVCREFPISFYVDFIQRQIKLIKDTKDARIQIDDIMIKKLLKELKHLIKIKNSPVEYSLIEYYLAQVFKIKKNYLLANKFSQADFKYFKFKDDEIRFLKLLICSIWVNIIRNQEPLPISRSQYYLLWDQALKHHGKFSRRSLEDFELSTPSINFIQFKLA